MIDGSTSQTTHAPLIGLTGRQSRGATIGAPDGFMDTPLDIYMREYANSVLAAGGIPVHIPLEICAPELMERLDGLVIAGGEDVDPRRFGQVPGAHTPRVDPLRDDTELALLAAAVDRGVPVLGICRGQQLINVAFGGTLIQHLEPGVGESHMAGQYPRAHRVHQVTFEPGTIAHQIYGEQTGVNSFHHQAIDEPGTGIVVTGRAADGIIESIQHAEHPVIAVQWHPECFGNDPIFDWLVDQARKLSPNLASTPDSSSTIALTAAPAAKENH